ncbi:bifunctional RNase H/acid phosphatase [Pilimelia columellifera]|uniref:Bifunctional RNase H/acid phosphatase n=1 Tax=Pilimelia columellifera subsp. columellifera TaxID=706583 RepID=A0ABN3NG96_9ACTN
MTAAGRRVVVEADGGSRGNPGPAGYGAVVRDAGTGELLSERAEALGVATNNVAEYSGLVAGLEAAAEVGAAEVHVRMDSKLVVEQMCGRWQIKNAGLRPLAARAAALGRRFSTVSYEWIPRAENIEADRLANEAMDAAAGRAVKPRTPLEVTEPPPQRTSSVGDATTPSLAPPADPADALTGWTPPPSDERLRLIIVRHGETDWTRQGRYAGRADMPLSRHGRAQAAALARRVVALDDRITAVVSSPLGRCVATAETIAAASGGGPVTAMADLVECDFGDWDGLTFVQVGQKWPAEHRAWLASPAVAPPGGESFQQVAVRARRALAAIRSRHHTGTVVLVSHVSPIKLLLRDALAAGDAFLHRLYLEPAGMSIVDTWPDGGVAVRCVNDTAHLPPRAG